MLIADRKEPLEKSQGVPGEGAVGGIGTRGGSWDLPRRHPQVSHLDRAVRKPWRGRWGITVVAARRSQAHCGGGDASIRQQKGEIEE